MISLLFTILNWARYFVMYLAILSAAFITVVLIVSIIVTLFP